MKFIAIAKVFVLKMTWYVNRKADRFMLFLCYFMYHDFDYLPSIFSSCNKSGVCIPVAWNRR